MTERMVIHCQHGVTRSRNGSLYGGCSSGLISGLCCERSLSVGMIQILIVRLLQGMEHLNYAFHPQEFFTKLDCFAQHNWVVRFRWHDRGSRWGPWGAWSVCNIIRWGPCSSSQFNLISDLGFGPNGGSIWGCKLLAIEKSLFCVSMLSKSKHFNRNVFMEEKTS